MTKQQMKYFVTTANFLNFTEAAKHLHITQPALSQQITAIEKELDLQLFFRTKKKVLLTPAAAILLKELPKYEQYFQDIIEQAKAANGGNEGVIRIGMTEGQNFPKEVFERYMNFKNAYSSIKIELKSYYYGELEQGLEKGEVDVVYCAEFEVEEKEYLYEAVAKDIGCAIVSRYHPLAGKRIHSINDLRDETIILLWKKENPVLSNRILMDFQNQGIHPKVKYVSSLNEKILYTELGEGVGIINRDSIGCYNPNIKILEGLDLTSIPFGFAWKKDNLNDSLPLFVNYMLGSSVIEENLI